MPLAAVVAVGWGVLATSNSQYLVVADSIANADQDTRFTGRFAGYQEGLHLFASSPIYGWGSGSAGDTMDALFVNHYHVTPHNILLKIAVEGGLIGVVLFTGLLWSCWRRLDRSQPVALVAISSVVALLGLGLTGSAIETLPSSWFAFALLGVAISSRRGNVPAPVEARAGTDEASRAVVAGPHDQRRPGGTGGEQRLGAGG